MEIAVLHGGHRVMIDRTNVMKLSENIQLEELVPGYPVYVIDHPKVQARVAQHGAQVMDWQPRLGEPLLYLSPLAVYKSGKAIRGGVPLCWPWFNAHPTDVSLPSHGFARTRFWELLSSSASADGVELVFELKSDDATRALWPFEFVLRVTLAIGETLRVSLETQNVGSVPFVVGEALHAYLLVKDIAEVRVKGLEDADYLDTVGERVMRQQEGEVIFDGEVDRQYVSTNAVEVLDGASGRRIGVEKCGSGTTTVWNPWVERAAALSDLPDEDYRRFVCVEPANAGNEVVTVPPGGKHVIESTIRVLG